MFCVAVRLCSERLRLVEKCIHGRPLGYRSLQRLLQLAAKLRVCGSDERQREGQVLVLVAEAALEVLWNIRSLTEFWETPMEQNLSREVSSHSFGRNISHRWYLRKVEYHIHNTEFYPETNESGPSNLCCLFTYLAYPLTPKIEAVCSSKMPIDFHWTTRYCKTHKIELVTLNLFSSLNMKDEVSYLFKATCRITVVYILIFAF
jgi:hypothetical protein